jgi:alpha 1,2-mannosyltransferase
MRFFFFLLCCSSLLCGKSIEERTIDWKNAVNNAPEYPSDLYAGRGVVIPAGGTYYLINAYINVHLLRESGCTLPIEIWYIGKKEIHPPIMKAIEKLKVVYKDVTEYFPYPIKGYEVKVHAIAASSFKEVLLLDADNVVLQNPEFLFNTEEYRETGALFWPDIQSLEKNNTLWNILELPPQKVRAQESGQLLIDKERCWLPLQLCIHMNKNSAFYYKHVLGDKDTFQLSWRTLNVPYYMCPHVPGILKRSDTDRSCGLGQIQRDGFGNPLFCHTTTYNWAQRYSLRKMFFNYTLPKRDLNDFNDENDPIYGDFQTLFPRFEERCLLHLRKVREIWRIND